MGPHNRIRDRREPKHFWADNEVVDEHLPEIGVYGFAVYMLLTRYANTHTAQCDPGVERIAKQLGISVPTVKKALHKLQECGLITIQERFRDKDGKKVYTTNLYTLLAVKPKNDLGNHVTQVDNDVTQGGQPEYPDLGNQVSINKTHENKTQLTRESADRNVSSPARTPAVQAYFDTISGNLSAAQVKAINDAVTDLLRWREVLKEWTLNGWSQKAIGKMLDRYSSGRTVADERPISHTNDRTPPVQNIITTQPDEPQRRPRTGAELREAMKRLEAGK